jgi:hypothetical protein
MVKAPVIHPGECEFQVEFIDESTVDNNGHNPLFLQRVIQMRTADGWEFVQVYTVEEPRRGVIPGLSATRVFAIFRRTKEKAECKG